MIRTIVLLAVAALSTFLLASCQKSTSSEPIDVTATETQAYTSLENSLFSLSTSSINNSTDLDKINFADANSLFRKALEGNPNSATANFGAAITEIFGSYADPNINKAVKQWEGSNLGKSSNSSLLRFGIPKGKGDLNLETGALAGNFVRVLQVAITSPPTISQMQQVLRDYFLPHLDYALDRFAIVEQHPEFEFKITGKMQGDSKISAVYLDGTEVYIMDAMVRLIRAWVEQFLIFKFDMPDYQTKSVVAALQPGNTSFFVLATDGVSRAQSTKNDVLGAVLKVRNALSFLRSETDDQSDDIIKRGPGGISDADIDSTLSALSRLENTLTNGVTARGVDSDGNSYTFQVNLLQFYNNPPQYPKTQWLPQYTVDSTAAGDILWRWTAQDYASFTFPDPTFSGVFPGMTNETLKRLLYIDEAFAWKLSVYLYDNDGMLSVNTAVNLIVNSKTYLPKPQSYSYYSNYSRNAMFYVLDNPNLPAQITVTDNAVSVPLEFNGTLVVTPKSYMYADIDLTLAPQNITATAYSNPRYVFLNCQKYGNYLIQRKTSGNFQTIDSIYYSSYYYDYNVVGGAAYQYRLKQTRYPYSYLGVSGIRANNFSNTVSITVP